MFGPEPTDPVLGAALDALESAEQVLFDSVEQVHMDGCRHRGRVVLVGDAAWCVTLYAGMGASIGMAGADLLGTMPARHPHSVTPALAEREQRLRGARTSPITRRCRGRSTSRRAGRPRRG
ncbi:hypothetical protein [Microbispora sp. KK1-11]|uniref:hypothetical protein n=1 Tax=Microbispora sp. KK1-11 TaxID=2053005 RepID=UPI001C8ED823|nr:hypothetical protein [Microbispora sp. KK1-11]